MGQKTQSAAELLEHLNSCGVNAYLVKRTARQRLMGTKITEWVVAADAPMPKILSMASLLPGISCAVDAENQQEIILSDDNGLSDTVRIYSLWRRPKEEFLKFLGSGFTIDSLVLRSADNHVADAFAGVKDIKSGLIRKTAHSDLRELILTAPIVAAETGFSFESETLQFLREHAETIRDTDPAAVNVHFNEMLAKYPVDLVDACVDGAYSKIFPSVSEYSDEEKVLASRLVAAVPTELRAIAMLACGRDTQALAEEAGWILSANALWPTFCVISEHLHDNVFDLEQQLSNKEKHMLVTLQYHMAQISGQMTDDLLCAKEMADNGEEIVSPSPLRGMAFAPADIGETGSSMIDGMFVPLESLDTFLPAETKVPDVFTQADAMPDEQPCGQEDTDVLAEDAIEEETIAEEVAVEKTDDAEASANDAVVEEDVFSAAFSEGTDTETPETEQPVPEAENLEEFEEDVAEPIDFEPEEEEAFLDESATAEADVAEEEPEINNEPAAEEPLVIAEEVDPFANVEQDDSEKPWYLEHDEKVGEKPGRNIPRPATAEKAKLPKTAEVLIPADVAPFDEAVDEAADEFAEEIAAAEMEDASVQADELLGLALDDSDEVGIGDVEVEIFTGESTESDSEILEISQQINDVLAGEDDEDDDAGVEFAINRVRAFMGEDEEDEEDETTAHGEGQNGQSNN